MDPSALTPDCLVSSSNYPKHIYMYIVCDRGLSEVHRAGGLDYGMAACSL